jgi:hypothetical protein
MTIEEALTLWETIIPREEATRLNLYPEPWVIRLWCSKYSFAELSYAVDVAAHKIQTCELQRNVETVGRYITGILRRNHEVEEAIAARVVLR